MKKVEGPESSVEGQKGVWHSPVFLALDPRPLTLDLLLALDPRPLTIDLLLALDPRLQFEQLLL